jgi:hypothetical protein
VKGLLSLLLKAEHLGAYFFLVCRFSCEASSFHWVLQAPNTDITLNDVSISLLPHGKKKNQKKNKIPVLVKFTSTFHR